MPKYGVKRSRKAPVEDSSSGNIAPSSSPNEVPILPPNPPAASASAARPAQQFNHGAADTPITSLLRGLPMDHYPFSLMPLIADYLQSDEHIYKKGITRPTIKNSNRHESKLRVFPTFAPFCAAPPVEDDEDDSSNKQKSLSEYAPTYHLIWLFQTIVLPTRFGNKHEPLYDGDVPPSYYFPQPPTDDEVEAFYTHPEVRAAMPAVSEEERERFRKARPLAQLRKERRTEKHKVYQGGCWVIKSTGNHLSIDKDEASNNPTTTTTPHHHVIDTHARGTAPFRLIHPTISARGGASGAVGMQLSTAVTHLTYRRNTIFGPPNTLPYNNYSDPSLVLGIERGMYGGYEGMMRGALYFEVWWGWGKAAKNKGVVAAVGGGVPTLLPERGYGDDCRASPHSSVMYLPPKQYNILDQNRQSGDNADDSLSDEGDDATTVDGEEDPATEEERIEKEHRSKALIKAKRALRQQVIDELVLARPLTHLRKHFPIGSLSAQVEVSVQTDDQPEGFMGVAPPPLVHPHMSYEGTPWKLEEDGGLSSLVATAYHADGRPLPPSHELRFLDPRTTTTDSGVAEEDGSPRITVTTRWSNHTGEDMATGGLAKCVGVQTEWEDLPIPPPKHFAHYFPPAVARQAKKQS